MSIPKDLLYTESHEWVKMDGDKALIGLTDFAQHALGDLVFVNLPEVGDNIVTGNSFADVESVKAVSDVYSPLTATVIRLNEDLLDSPHLINQTPYEAWLIEVGDITAHQELLTAEEYQKLCDKGDA